MYKLNDKISKNLQMAILKVSCCHWSGILLLPKPSADRMNGMVPWTFGMTFRTRFLLGPVGNIIGH
jgi:hypothetical protein